MQFEGRPISSLEYSLHSEGETHGYIGAERNMHIIKLFKYIEYSFDTLIILEYYESES